MKHNDIFAALSLVFVLTVAGGCSESRKEGASRPAEEADQAAMGYLKFDF